MYRKILLLILCFAQALTYGKSITISGYITNSTSGELLINATVFDQHTKHTTVSNSFGFYSLTVPEGSVSLQFSYIGYEKFNTDLYLTKDTTLTIKLEEKENLKEVVVYGQQKGINIHSAQMSAINIPVSQLKNIPSLMGENDVIKALQLLPGVKAGTEGSAGMYVRGGGPDENLLILDGVPVYNVNHLFGFFSVFNVDAIKDVTLYKGNFPARFGGRLSSVVDINMNDGNNQHIHGAISVGLLSSKINIEGPILKNKTTFNISARRTYADLLAQPFIKKMASDENGSDKNTSLGYYFYDINAKVSHKFTERDRLYLSFYQGDDVIYGDMQQYKNDNGTVGGIETGRLKLDWNWGNRIAALRWNHVLTNKLFMNATVSASKYRFNLSEGTTVRTTKSNPEIITQEQKNIGYKSGIQDYNSKLDFDWNPGSYHRIKFGTQFCYHIFKPGVSVLQYTDNQNSNIQNKDTTFGDSPVNATEISAYAEDNFSIGDRVELNLGLHYSAFSVQGELYNPLPQPRIGVRVNINDDLSLKTSFATMSQYIHLLSNSNISLPTDLWVPVTKRIAPMTSGQFALGLFYNFKNLINFSVEGYYKSMNNLIEYKDGASFMGSETGWEDKVYMGKGKAYGIELMAQKTVGRTTGWVSYTWSRALRQFNRKDQEINSGEIFPAKYDRPHSFSLVVMHKISNKTDIAGTWVINSGNCGTLAMQNFDGTQIPQTTLNKFSNEGTTLPYISNRNNYRFNTYHRLDLGINFHKQKKHGIRTWSFGIYNAYNHMNPFMVSINEKKTYDPATNGYTKVVRHLTQTTLFPIIPSVSYSYKF